MAKCNIKINCKCDKCRNWWENIVYKVFYRAFLVYFTIRRKLIKSDWEEWK